MTATRAYLDHNASAPLLPAAKEAMLAALELTGNPSSVHAEGRALRQVLDTARRQVALLANAEPKQVVFTGSATEAITQAIVGGAEHFGIDRVVLSAGEHAAVAKAADLTGLPVTVIGLNVDGTIDVEALKQTMAEAESAGELLLVAVHSVNNETGVVQPLGQIEALVGPTRHLLFVDAVQALGKMELGFASRAADMMAISAHKIGGPAGVGALLVKAHGDEVRIIPGGGQEQGRRGGTEPVSLIAGFGAAAAHYVEALRLQDRKALVSNFESRIRALHGDVVIFGEDAPRIGAVSNFALPGVQASVAMMALDLDGVAVSSGSACSSGKVGRSHVLAAMQVEPHVLDCALRMSVGWSSTENDIELLLEALGRLLARKQNQNGQAA